MGSTYSEWIEALEIFSKYEHVQGFSADHDEVFAGPNPEVVSDDDSTKLIELGWYPSDYDCFRKYV